VVKGVKGEFTNIGTGGNISRGGHLFSSIWSHDTRLTLFVKGGDFRYFDDLFGKTLKYPLFWHIYRGLRTCNGCGVYLETTTDFP